MRERNYYFFVNVLDSVCFWIILSVEILFIDLKHWKQIKVILLKKILPSFISNYSESHLMLSLLSISYL
jgi:hypothetical protein